MTDSTDAPESGALLPFPHHMVYALLELGTVELPGARHNSRILEYHAETTLGAAADEVPWCAAFVSWALAQAGLPTIRSAASRAWLDYGTPVDRPQLGDLVILARGSGGVVAWRPGREPGGAPGAPWVPGHVGFYVDRVGSALVQVLGGNQGNRVSVRRYPAERVVGFRRPEAA